MFASERKRKIKELLSECREMDINTMCSILSASTSTIRRDLDRLEEEGFLKRTHGGAVLAEREEPGENTCVPEHSPEQMSASLDRAAELASRMVKPGEQIFLGSGMVCYRMACYLEKSWSGTVVTNNLNAAIRLKDSGISVILLGGELKENQKALYTEGAAAAGEIREIVLNKAFVTFSGIMKEFGYFVDSKEQAELYNRLKANSLEMIAVAPKEVFDQIGRVRYGDLGFFPKVVSSMDLPEVYKSEYFNRNVALYTSVAGI